MTEQTGHVLETEIVAGVFFPVAEDNRGYSIGSSSTLKTFVTVVHNPGPHVFSISLWAR